MVEATLATLRARARAGPSEVSLCEPESALESRVAPLKPIAFWIWAELHPALTLCDLKDGSKTYCVEPIVTTTQQWSIVTDVIDPLPLTLAGMPPSARIVAAAVGSEMP